MNDAEIEAKIARIVQRLIRNQGTENYWQGYGRVSAPFSEPSKAASATNAGVLPPASDSVDLSGVAAGGDLSGSYPNPTVDGLQGRDVASTAPTDGQVLAYSTANARWQPGDPGGWQPEAVANSAEDDWVYGWNGTFWEVVVTNTT